MEAVSIGWKCRGQCKGFVDMGGVFHAHKEKPFLPIMTNADRIRAMSDEELADQLVIKIDGLEECSLYLSAPTGKMFISQKEASRVTLDWLRQPAEED